MNIHALGGISASLRTVDLLNAELSYQYVNEPMSNAPGTMEIHRGTATLELIGSSLEGDYYTGRGRGRGWDTQAPPAMMPVLL